MEHYTDLIFYLEDTDFMGTGLKSFIMCMYFAIVDNLLFFSIIFSDLVVTPFPSENGIVSILCLNIQYFFSF